MSETQPPPAPTFAELLYAYALEHGMIWTSGRRAGDIKQTDIARAFNTDQQNVQRWLRGTIPQEWRVSAIARVLGVSLAELEQAFKATLGAAVHHQDDDTLSALAEVRETFSVWTGRVEALEQSEDRRNAQFVAIVTTVQKMIAEHNAERRVAKPSKRAAVPQR